jgi:hypothetical protein
MPYCGKRPADELMSRSRITLSIDEEMKLIIVRYIGDLDGDEVNTNMLQSFAKLDKPWTYDTIMDMRRFNGTIMTTEIEDLAKGWAQLVQGRDAGYLSAVISDDPLVRARFSITQSLFPQRILENFNTFDEGLNWIKTQRVSRDTAMIA